MTKIRVFEAFTGYGGAHFGLKRTKVDFEVVGISEVNKFAAVETYSSKSVFLQLKTCFYKEGEEEATHKA